MQLTTLELGLQEEIAKWFCGEETLYVHVVLKNVQ